MALTQLNAVNGGISRLRTKGGARPDTLYDLLNGYVDEAGAITSRPGTVVTHQLPVGTKGLCAFAGGLVVFSHQVVTGMPVGVRCEVLTHPNSPGVALSRIHYAGPFLGYLFVTAEFSDGQIFDYWLQSATVWQANTDYTLYYVVQPSAENGFTYQATRLNPAAPAWKPSTERAVGDVIEPTEANSFEYVAIETYGSPPRTGTIEPTWIAEEGAIVIEESDSTANPTPPSSDGSAQLPPDVADRYAGHIGVFGTKEALP